MPDGVLHQRLERHRRDPRVECLGIHLEPDRQAVGEPGLLDLQIGLHEAELFPQRHLVPLTVPERLPEQLAQAGDGGGRRLAPAVADEGGDGVERIEEEVRLELHSERGELGLGELGLEAHGLELAVAGRPVVLDRVSRGHDHPVDDEREMEVSQYDPRVDLGKASRRSSPSGRSTG